MHKVERRAVRPFHLGLTGTVRRASWTAQSQTSTVWAHSPRGARPGAAHRSPLPPRKAWLWCCRVPLDLRSPRLANVENQICLGQDKTSLSECC